MIPGKATMQAFARRTLLRALFVLALAACGSASLAGGSGARAATSFSPGVEANGFFDKAKSILRVLIALMGVFEQLPGGEYGGIPIHTLPGPLPAPEPMGEPR